MMSAIKFAFPIIRLRHIIIFVQYYSNCGDRHVYYSLQKFQFLTFREWRLGLMLSVVPVTNFILLYTKLLVKIRIGEINNKIN